MKKTFSAIVLVTILLWSAPLKGAMSGGDYEITVDGFVVADGSGSSGGNYDLNEYAGDFSSGDMEGGNIDLEGGFYFASDEGLSTSLSKSTISLTFPSSPLSTVVSDSLILTVTTDSVSGYATSIGEDGNLRSGANDINDVIDGSVTAGSEEYGIRTTGGDGLLATDTAISGSVALASSAGPASGNATTVTFRVGVAQSTISGSYSHIVTLTTVVNP